MKSWMFPLSVVAIKLIVMSWMGLARTAPVESDDAAAHTVAVTHAASHAPR